jgi:hypothetical protein
VRDYEPDVPRLSRVMNRATMMSTLWKPVEAQSSTTCLNFNSWEQASNTRRGAGRRPEDGRRWAKSIATGVADVDFVELEGKSRGLRRVMQAAVLARGANLERLAQVGRVAVAREVRAGIIATRLGGWNRLVRLVVFVETLHGERGRDIRHGEPPARALDERVHAQLPIRVRARESSESASNRS